MTSMVGVREGLCCPYCGTELKIDIGTDLTSHRCASALVYTGKPETQLVSLAREIRREEAAEARTVYLSTRRRRLHGIVRLDLSATLPMFDRQRLRSTVLMALGVDSSLLPLTGRLHVVMDMAATPSALLRAREVMIYRFWSAEEGSPDAERRQVDEFRGWVEKRVRERAAELRLRVRNG